LNIYKNKVVLVTGHTGFKGSWLVSWLTLLGARVIGLSLDLPSKPSNFEVAGLRNIVKDYRIDIRDNFAVCRVIRECQPDFVFHLAAKALVRTSYVSPLDTLTTNAIGTANVLEGLRHLNKKAVAIMITSDKVYDNVEWEYSYRESDRLGGSDPYSASKGAAELTIKSFIYSFFPMDGLVRIGIGRAGNVIGGGDWALDRIVPDCVRAWSVGEAALLRNPIATRPWQHVLEPLSGYLALANELYDRPDLHGQPFNFGPPANQNHTVLELVQVMSRHWDKVR